MSMEEEPEPVGNPYRKADYRLPKMYTMTPRQYYNDCEILCTKLIYNKIFWYRDRSGLPRGPMTVDVLKRCWVNGIVDENTLMWGNGQGDWVPLRNLRGMAEVLHNPMIVFLKWVNEKVAYPKEERRANRQRLFEQGKARRPVMDKEEVRDWRRTRTANLIEGKEHMMLSLSLALPLRGGGLGERLTGMLGRRRNKAKQGSMEQELGGEEGAGVRSA
uniref:GYF domain-containing protein n=1 Tax=Mantoniella antarctica TaxID=81844 RepID=A0A7S0SEB6_9CHLO|mmetsp:Transcript_18047/g.44708  ORF Transcript_18047/g.44708 Transcript_18047/m.44708 type:complete len:217 (+) Transcript_18047:178-828(+)